jgi:two-component system response regulator QseB
MRWSNNPMPFTWLRDGLAAARALRDPTADLVLLDLGLPGMDGMDVLLEARRQGVKTPILVLTARDAIDTRIRGLDLGADDFLVKPFHLGELAACIRSLTRRAQGLADNLIEADGMRLNLATAEVEFRDEKVSLTRREFALLQADGARRPHRAPRCAGKFRLRADTVVERNAIEVQVQPPVAVDDAPREITPLLLTLNQ